MIVTTGKLIVIEGGTNLHYRFKRDSRHPGLVTLHFKLGEPGSDFINLPGNKKEAQSIIEAYQRIVDEDIEYRESEIV